jgi:hypothetical protein
MVDVVQPTACVFADCFAILVQWATLLMGI